MIEIIENSIQLGTLTVCTIMTALFSLRKQSQEGASLAMFYSSYVLGDLFWLLYLICYGHIPRIFYVSYLSWYAAFLFLYMLLQRISTEEERKSSNPFACLLPAFCIAMSVFYMQWGDYAGNLVSAALMSMLMFHTVRGLLFLRSRPEEASRRYLYYTVLLFCILEYCAWTASCFFSGDDLSNPYYWADFLITVCMVFLLPALRKAVVP